MLLTAADGDRIVQELKEAIGRDVNIMDRAGIIIASTDPRRVGQTHAIAQRLIAEGLPILEVRKGDLPGVQEGINLPIEVDGTCEGVIGITGPVDAVRKFGTIAKKMTEILLTSLRQQEQQTLLERARNLYVQEWLFSPDVDWAAFALRGQLLHIDPDQSWLVGLLEYAGAPDDPSVSELHSNRLVHLIETYLRGDPAAIWAMVNRRILILFNGNPKTRSDEIFRSLHHEIVTRWNIPLGGGLSSPSRNAEDLRRCYTEAKIAAHAAVQDCSVRTYSNASLEFILQNIDAKIKNDVRKAVFPPMPEQERKELLECLRLYFLCDGNIEAAAEKACVHKNTFRYRMQKLCNVTGYDLRKPRDSVMLYMALQFFDEQHGH